MEEILNFYRSIDKIKHIQRKGWYEIGVRGVTDTIASHSYGATLIGWIISLEEKVDENKIIKFLLVHDLIMAELGDFTPRDKEYLSKKELERKAFDNLKSKIPEKLKKEFEILFKQYNEQITEEAKLAREADKLETLFQCILYSERLDRNEMKQFIESYENLFKSKTGARIFNEIKQKYY